MKYAIIAATLLASTAAHATDAQVCRVLAPSLTKAEEGLGAFEKVVAGPEMDNINAIPFTGAERRAVNDMESERRRFIPVLRAYLDSMGYAAKTLQNCAERG